MPSKQINKPRGRNWIEQTRLVGPDAWKCKKRPSNRTTLEKPATQAPVQSLISPRRGVDKRLEKRCSAPKAANV